MKWRSDALERRGNDSVAWSLYWTALMWGGKRISLDDFHPLRRLEKAQREAELAAQAEEVMKILPRAMTENEIDDQWRAMQESGKWPKG